MKDTQRYYYIERTQLFRSGREAFAVATAKALSSYGQKEGRILVTQIMDFLAAQTDKLVLAGMLALIILSALQLTKMSRTNRQLKYLTEKLAGYLKAVLEDEEEEEAEDPQETEFVSQQEQNMREAIELQKQQKKMKDAQVFDAVLSEIYP